MDVNAILEAVYLIQGQADPNHPADSLEERMQAVYQLACMVMDRTGYQPQ